jgi:hypothetical protein
MGHGLPRHQAFGNRLEAHLNATRRPSAQIINAGVQGYATYHEYHAFLDSLVFDPDLITYWVLHE